MHLLISGLDIPFSLMCESESEKKNEIKTKKTNLDQKVNIG